MNIHPNATGTVVTNRPLACGPEDGGTGHRVELALPNGGHVDLVVSIAPDSGAVLVDIAHDEHVGQLDIAVNDDNVFHQPASW
ncbi:hypothetical protein [Rhodococcus rhodochrous]|uniref:hypothetical protein n=1 Tax=Rhodococcus rhodochrous TaxID=1829 RepID=UPI001784A55B|nr:hypothetical protein [Rhodococcus rhodochrous]QOH59835.1 hypothetical protein C6Y44_27465 [Rhodococcus rhodochrous]